MCSGSPASRSRSWSISAASSAASSPSTLERLAARPAPRRRRSTNAWRPAVAAEPFGPSSPSAACGQLGDLARLGDQDRRADRVGHQRARRRPPAGQSPASTRVTASGPGTPAGRGVDGERDGGGVGDRVRAGDPGRVLGRERREAEVLGARGRLRRAPRATTTCGAGAGPAAPRRRRDRELTASRRPPATSRVATRTPSADAQPVVARARCSSVGDEVADAREHGRRKLSAGSRPPRVGRRSREYAPRTD